MTHIEVTKTFPFDIPANYNYNNKIEVNNSIAQLVGTPLIPYAHWKMNESSPSSTVADSSPNNFTGTVTGDQTFVAGKLNNAKYFDGTTNINFGNILNFSRTDPMTFEFYLKTTDDSGYILSKFTTPGGQLKGIGVSLASGQIRFALYGNNINRLIVTGNTIVNTGVFKKITITYDGSSLVSGVKIYVDNSPANNIVGQDTLNSSITNDADLIMGSYGGSNLIGWLDEIVIYTKVLTTAERDFRYNSGTGTELLYEGYSIDSPPIENITGEIFEGEIESFVETVTTPVRTGIKYQISADNGNTWQYWTGAAWATITADQTDAYYFTNEANLASDINANIITWVLSGNFKFRAFLNSEDSYYTPEIDTLTTTYKKEEEISTYYMTSKFD